MFSDLHIVPIGGSGVSQIDVDITVNNNVFRGSLHKLIQNVYVLSAIEKNAKPWVRNYSIN